MQRAILSYNKSKILIELRCWQQAAASLQCLASSIIYWNGEAIKCTYECWTEIKRERVRDESIFINRKHFHWKWQYQGRFEANKRANKPIQWFIYLRKMTQNERNNNVSNRMLCAPFFIFFFFFSFSIFVVNRSICCISIKRPRIFGVEVI